MSVHHKYEQRMEPGVDGRQSSPGAHYYHVGTKLRLHNLPPPPVTEFDEWTATQLVHATAKDAVRARSKMDGAKLRRMVVMRRNGCSFAEIGRVTGLSGCSARTWLTKLPPGLRP